MQRQDAKEPGSIPAAGAAVGNPLLTPSQQSNQAPVMAAASYVRQSSSRWRAASIAATISAAPAPGIDDDTDCSSDDDDDNYEFGEAKIKRTFSMAQRKSKKLQRLQAQQQRQQQATQADFSTLVEADGATAAAGVAASAAAVQAPCPLSPAPKQWQVNAAMQGGALHAAALAAASEASSQDMQPAPSAPMLMGVNSNAAAAATAASAAACTDYSAGPHQSGSTTAPAPAAAAPVNIGDGKLAPGKEALLKKQPTGAAVNSSDAGQQKDQHGPSELQAEFQGLSLFEDDDEEDGEGEERKRKWYKRSLVWMYIVACALSAILMFTGTATQYIPGWNVVNANGIALWRWMYFWGFWPVLWAMVYYINKKLFAVVEWMVNRGAALYYLDNVRRTARALFFMCLVLPWYVICFRVLSCGNGGCKEEGEYKKATGIVWKLMVCLTLFSLANFLKSVVTKLLSSHFYRTAHFAKVQEAIEKEYYLLMLSQPRPAAKAVEGRAVSCGGGIGVMGKLLKLSSATGKAEGQGNAEERGKKIFRSRSAADHELTAVCPPLHTSVSTRHPEVHVHAGSPAAAQLQGQSANTNSQAAVGWEDIINSKAAAASNEQTGSAAASAATVNGASDQLLQAGMLEKITVLGSKSSMRPGEWSRLRSAIALKTFTALMKRYQNMTEAEEAKKMKEARRFAKGLFYNIRADPSRRYLIRDDFTPFFDSPVMADQAFAYFDKDKDACFTMREMKDSVMAIFKERKNMAASLQDTDSIVSTLEFGIGFLFHFLFSAIYLFVWGMDIMKGFSTFSATVLALTFVFGNSIRQIYESMLFLFVEHAFDVGDLLEVEGVTYRVKKIDLMYTVIVKSTGERCYYPNVRLISLPVINLTRSAAKSDKVVFLLNVGSAGAAAREALLRCVKSHYDENDSEFNSCPSVNFTNITDPFKVQLQVTWTYNFGADEFKRAATAKTGLLEALHNCLGNLEELEYTIIKESQQTLAALQSAGTTHMDMTTRSGRHQDGQQDHAAAITATAAAVVGITGVAAM